MDALAVIKPLMFVPAEGDATITAPGYSAVRVICLVGRAVPK